MAPKLCTHERSAGRTPTTTTRGNAATNAQEVHPAAVSFVFIAIALMGLHVVYELIKGFVVFVLTAFPSVTLFAFRALFVYALWHVGCSFPAVVNVYHRYREPLAHDIWFVYYRLRTNSTTQSLSNQWQRVCCWLNRNILKLAALLLAIGLISRYIETQHRQVKLVRWSDLGPSWDVPAHLLQPRKTDGSNCHYQQPTLEDEEIGFSGSAADLVADILDHTAEMAQDAAPADTTISAGKLVKIQIEDGAETKTVFLDGRRTWCKQCQQWHCCETPY